MFVALTDIRKSKNIILCGKAYKIFKEIDSVM